MQNYLKKNYRYFICHRYDTNTIHRKTHIKNADIDNIGIADCGESISTHLYGLLF